MGRRGPAPKPTRLKILTGNPGKRKINKREPQPTKGVPSCPTCLSKDARTEWRRIVPELRKLGLLTLMDRTALASYCQAWAELQEATRILDRDGRIIDSAVWGKETKDGVRKELGTVSKLHPAVKLQRDAFTRVKQFLAEFGLTPASRTRFSTPEEKPEADSFEEFLQRGKKA